MAVTLAEYKADFGSGAPTLVTTPVTGDVALLVYANTGGGSPAAVSGLGGTWTKVGTWSASGDNSGTGTGSFAGTFHQKVLEYWVCYNPTTAGAITVTGSHGGQMAYLVRGLPAGSTATASAVETTNAVDRPGPSQNASSGSFVLAHGLFTDVGGITFPGTCAPAAGWTSASTGLASGWCNTWHSYRVPTESSATAHQIIPTQTSTAEPDLVGQVVLAPPTAAQVESVYAETLVTGTPAAQVESTYAEALVTGTPAAQVESTYAEVLVPSTPTYGIAFPLSVGLTGALGQSALIATATMPIRVATSATAETIRRSAATLGLRVGFGPGRPSVTANFPLRVGLVGGWPSVAANFPLKVGFGPGRPSVVANLPLMVGFGPGRPSVVANLPLMVGLSGEAKKVDAWRLWTGTEEIALSLEGEWNGSAVAPLLLVVT